MSATPREQVEALPTSADPPLDGDVCAFCFEIHREDDLQDAGGLGIVEGEL